MIGFVFCLLLSLTSADKFWKPEQVPVNKDCRKIPLKPFPTMAQWVNSGPNLYDFTTDEQFICAQKTFAFPLLHQNYSGHSLITKGNHVTAYQYQFNDDRTMVETLICGTNEKIVYNCIGSKVEPDGSTFYCATVCDGNKIQQFVCVSNNFEHFKELEEEIKASVQGVPIAGKIREAQENCLDLGPCAVYD